VKASERLRQNSKVSRRARNKARIPAIRQRASKVLGKLLPALPGVPEMLVEIRTQFNIPLIDQGEDIEDRLVPGQVIDWAGVRRELEERLHALPDVLPRELLIFQKLIDFRSRLEGEPRFSEPITPKLREDVLALYRAFVQLYDFSIDNLARPWQKAAEGFYAAAADNLCDFLRYGVGKPVPQDWITQVRTMPLFGEKMVVAMASNLSDPDEVVEEFREEFARTFGKRRPKLTITNVEIAEYLGMRHRGMSLTDIASTYIERHRSEFPANQQSERFKSKRRTLEDTLKHSLKSTQKRMDTLLGD